MAHRDSRDGEDNRAKSYITYGAVSLAAFVVVAVLMVGSGLPGWLHFGSQPAALAAAGEVTSPTAANRTDCAEIFSSSLRSPAEGVWYQANCATTTDLPVGLPKTECNRTALDPAEFTLVSTGLYSYRQSPSSPAFLWFASSESCFDLVSERIVSAVCADQSISFDWDTRSTCSGHGGVLAWVNGR